MSGVKTFTPTPENTRQLRDAFGCFATGVTVVTASTDLGPIAITANSFSSLSLDPALVLWSPGKASQRFNAFVQADHFAIHVLAADQQDLCWNVAKDGFALRTQSHSVNAEGVPTIAGCLARFECANHAVHDGGDHAIVVGEVIRIAQREDGAPLTFYKGQISAFDPT